MTNFLKKLFRPKGQTVPHTLAIDGIPPAPITAEPDDAETAAQALLEMMADKARHHGYAVARHHDLTTPRQDSDEGAESYYRILAKKIRQAHRAAAIRTTRFVAACEYQLKDKHLPLTGEGSLSLLEAELYKRIDIIEREGGDLKRRWQHCLAEVMVRMMEAAPSEIEK